MKEFYIGDLRIPIPIIQGGMGIGISMSGLASAVANMGGVGVISTVGIGLVRKGPRANYRQSNIDAIRNEIRRARKKTLGVLGVNIMSVITNFSDMVKTSIEEKIDIIFSGAGLPLDLPKYLREDSKTKLVPIVSSARATSIICNKWVQNYNYLPDAIVVEGPRAGGHLGFKRDELELESNRLENIITEVMKVVNEIEEKYHKHIPVIAAGGIYDGDDAFKIMELGASGVQLGTRFVTTRECDASHRFKKAFVKAEEQDIQIITSPVGMPGRTIFNNFLKEASEGKRKPKSCKYHCLKSCNPKTTNYCIAEALFQAYRGKLSDGFAFTGANTARVSKISTVKKVFTELVQEYFQAKKDHK
ncbi:MAG: nitronate monooxygenase [Bacteroidales bacterium]|nr:nitronate monooxygenase [Bacteroidales bacterium]